MILWPGVRPTAPHLGSGLKTLEPRSLKEISGSIQQVNQAGVCRADAGTLTPFPLVIRMRARRQSASLVSETATQACDPQTSLNNSYKQLHISSVFLQHHKAEQPLPPPLGL